MAIMTPSLLGSRALLALGVLVVISACGGEPGSGRAASSPPISISAAPQPSTTAKAVTTQQTLSGVIVEGIRPNCRVLQTSQRRYALTGPATARLRQGDNVTVTGVERTDLVNPCGLTFVVASIK
jgi:hypothetical protein